MTPRVLVLGGGVAGLTTALALARGGVPVDVLERDGASAPFGRRSAALWVRDGAPQGQHAHVFGPACHQRLATGLPDVLALLLDAGAREVETSGVAGTGLALRRPLLDWVLRRIAEREPGVHVHSGAAVTGLHTHGDGPVEVAVGGGMLTADLVVDATGGLSPLIGRLGEPDVDAGRGPVRPATTYYSRCYALRWLDEPGPLNLGLAAGGEFDGYSCHAVPGDNRTVTVTFGVPGERPADGSGSDGGLAVLRMPDCFQAAAERVPRVAEWAEPGAADPLGGVAVLSASAPDRTRSAVPDRRGLVAVGDAAAPHAPVEQGVAVALAQAFTCAAAVLDAGGEVPADLGDRVRGVAGREAVPAPPGPRRSPAGPSGHELARIAESAGAGTRISA